MTSLPVDAPAVGAPPSRQRDTDHDMPAALPQRDRDGSPDAVAQWDAWRTALLWLAVIVLLTTNAAFDVAQLQSARAPGVRWWTIWLVSTREGVVTSAFLFAAIRLSKRFTIDRMHRRWLGVHIVAALVLSGLTTAEIHWYASVALLEDPIHEKPRAFFFAMGLVVYAIVALCTHALVYSRRYWQVRGVAHRMRDDLADAARRRAAAELRALKAEINPHFLGNALQAIGTLVRTDAAAAERVLAELGGLLRVALARSQTQEVTLREELETLEPFLDVERARLGRSFEARLDIEADALDAIVPDMILQPMVEHAVRRAPALRTSGGIGISARRTGPGGAMLELRVTADEAGAPAAPVVPLAPPAAAAWVANARARLAELYGAAAMLEIVGGAADRAVGARLTMPWRDSDSDAAPSIHSAAADAAPAAEAPPRARAWRTWRPPLVPTVSLAVLWILNTLLHLQRQLPDKTTVPVPLTQAIPAGFLAAAILVAIGCTAFRLARRYPPAAPGESVSMRWRALLAHARAAILLGFFGSSLRMLNSWAVGYLYDSVAQIRWAKAFAVTVGLAAFYMLIYLVLAGIAYGLEYRRRYRQTRAAARKLSEELAEVGRRRAAAELCALKAELNPHFLGNALHTVSALVRTDPDAAGRVLAHLGELLRVAVTRSRTQEVTLREELETLEPYLAVAQARLGRRLEIAWDVDEALLDARVPHMILQPLVENAVKHGLVPRRTAGRVEVAARRTADRLELAVRDDGIGLADIGPRAGTRDRGVGLANTRARLAELYGDAATFELTSAAATGAVARLSLPWRGVITTPLGLTSDALPAPQRLPA